MGGTNAGRAKRALITAARVALAANPATEQVTVTYSYRGHEHDRELVHADRAYGPQSYPVSGRGGARFKRDENLTIKLHVVVHLPGADEEEAEARAIEIGTVLEEMIAATAALPTFESGELISVGITAVDLDSDGDDDGATAVLSYDIGVNSRLN